MKYLFNLLVLSAALVFAACEKGGTNENPKEPTPPSVYVAGMEGGYATLWKDGTAQRLSDETSYAEHICVSGGDVYVAGLLGNKARTSTAVYWKNGVINKLSESTVSSADCIAVVGNNVYVGGHEGFKAVIWVNGAMQTLSNNPSRILSICILGSDVYAAGIEADGTVPYATLWKNGVAKKLDERGDTEALSVAVSDGDVYVSGRHTFSASAILWTNGEAQTLEGGSSADQVFIAGDDVYVAGYGSDKAMLWKNGNRQELQGGRVAISVCVLGDDVYAAGTGGSAETGTDSAVVWTNGVPQELGKLDIASYAYHVVVK